MSSNCDYRSMVVEVAAAFIVESKDTELVTKEDRLLPLCWLW